MPESVSAIKHEDMLASYEESATSRSKVIKPIELLNWFACSSIPNSSHVDINDSLYRLSTMSSGYILSHIGEHKEYVDVVDADLLSYSINKLSSIMSSLIIASGDVMSLTIYLPTRTKKSLEE